MVIISYNVITFHLYLFIELEKIRGNQKKLTSSQEALRKEAIHRFHILRMRLLYFTNTLNSHIMHQVSFCF